MGKQPTNDMLIARHIHSNSVLAMRSIRGLNEVQVEVLKGQVISSIAKKMRVTEDFAKLVVRFSVDEKGSPGAGT